MQIVSNQPRRSNDRGLATVAPGTLPSVSLRLADITDLTPVSSVEFITEITPCLMLVAPVGMDEDAQAAWFEIAYMALEGIPIALLRRGCKAALRNADHPSKIVREIIKAIGEDWDWRKKHARPDVTPVAPEPKAIEDNSPLSFDEIKSMSPALLSLGRSQGWVRQEDYDRLIAKGEAA